MGSWKGKGGRIHNGQRREGDGHSLSLITVWSGIEKELINQCTYAPLWNYCDKSSFVWSSVNANKNTLFFSFLTGNIANIMWCASELQTREIGTETVLTCYQLLVGSEPSAHLVLVIQHQQT